ncbi:MAG: hypothetical protein LBE79_10440 [Tannerella sp.]|jgi:outer membrane protein insertion porin family|nr:hypothetical protein [Tannerella sp.]
MYFKQNMYKKFLLFCLAALVAIIVKAQDNIIHIDSVKALNSSVYSDTTANNNRVKRDTVPTHIPQQQNDEPLPVVSYSLNNNKVYTIAGIKVSGVEKYGYEDYVLIGISGLAVGQKVTVPGEEITAATKKFWKHGLFSDVTIAAAKEVGDSVWLDIRLKPTPVISTINYTGVKKSEREEIEAKSAWQKVLSSRPISSTAYVSESKIISTAKDSVMQR